MNTHVSNVEIWQKPCKIAGKRLMNGKYFLCFIISNYIYIFRDTDLLLIRIWLKFAVGLVFTFQQSSNKNTIIEESERESRGSDTIVATMMTTTTTTTSTTTNGKHKDKDKWIVCWLLSSILNALYPVYNGDSKTMKLPPSYRYIMSSYDHYDIK